MNADDTAVIADRLAEALRAFIDAYHSPQTATGRAAMMLNAERAASAVLAEWWEHKNVS